MSVMTETKRPRPVVLCVLDGWGYREDPADNAVAQGNTPVFDALWQAGPHALLHTSGGDVGLPDGQMGNSEVGHMSLGAGRIVLQDLPMIDKAITAGEFDRNAALQGHIQALKQSGGTCHLMGLLSPGGVHSHQDHIVALARTLTLAGVPVVVHAFTDGRDVPPKSAREQVARFLKDIEGLSNLRMGTVDGRYYAMDRDKRWERVQRAYEAMVAAKGNAAPDALTAIDQSYQGDVTDEFILPTVIDGYTGMRDGDGLLMTNFRADRAREILTALLDPAFKGFERGRPVRFAAATGMVEYSADLNQFLTAIFPPKELTHVLGEVVANAGLKQLRIAETEKYPHVTFFLNGGEEKQYPGEDRILVPSPKVATYDLQPEMSAPEVTDKLVAAIDSGQYDLVVINYANPDMVGHSGILQAAIKAVETVDHCLGRLVEAVRREGGVLLVTADHGNSEMLRDPETGGPHTAHTLNAVPAILVNGPKDAGLRDGRLADVAPTLLELMGLPQPQEMTGRSLIDQGAARRAAE
jgi:2,3-bisphosphoglycerate-independent phosphoglycerate mutase